VDAEADGPSAVAFDVAVAGAALPQPAVARASPQAQSSGDMRMAWFILIVPSRPP
jgi:hypothetical protein